MDAYTIPMLLVVLLSTVGGYLYLRRAERSVDPDVCVIRALRNAGADVTRAHDIEFFLYFPDTAAAERAASKIAALGLAGQVSRSADDSAWLLKASKSMVPVDDVMIELRAKLNAIAAEGGGVYDGWGSPVVVAGDV